MCLWTCHFNAAEANIAKPVCPGFVGPSEEMADTIFVSNLPEDVGEVQLAEHFGAIGLIKVWLYFFILSPPLL